MRGYFRVFVACMLIAACGRHEQQPTKPNTPPRSTRLEWKYSTSKNPMDDTVSKGACLLSTPDKENIDNGDSVLCVSTFSSGRSVVYIVAPEGKLMNCDKACVLRAKIDGKLIDYVIGKPVLDPSDYKAITLNAAGMLAYQIKDMNELIIELPIFHQGNIAYKFKPNGLKWPLP